MSIDDGLSNDILNILAAQLKLPVSIQAFLSVPLKTEQGLAGALDLAIFPNSTLSGFTDANVQDILAITGHTASQIDRVRLHEIDERRRDLLIKLDKATEQFRGEYHEIKLRQDIVSQAVQLTGWTAAGLYINHQAAAQLELCQECGLGVTHPQQYVKHSSGLIGEVAAIGKAKAVSEYNVWPDRDLLLDGRDFHAMIAVPLKHDGETDYVLFVADSSSSQLFLKTDLEIISRYASRASMALRIAKLINPEHKRLVYLGLLHDIGDYMQTAPDLDVILHAVLTSVTAAYG